jgi:hypothetical protein
MNLVNVSRGESDRQENETFFMIYFISRGFFGPKKNKNKSSDSNGQDIFHIATNHYPNFYLSDEEWEKDLAAEIQDFEVVDDNVDESELDDLK